MRKLPEVMAELEFKRNMMHDTGMRLGLSHPETVKISQEVDVLHNEQMAIVAKNKNQGGQRNVG